ncbi:hypothetical protein NE237_023433 [Protea cynaroides]|uniref:Homeobox domain-containing protein n=1 Tax=Protea cynaroides TaxID=273540 RepID=A0A9Q0HCW4_9MAGN|nr:hypothetical protein NE237_023433 [Protea cynaroides]
MVTWPSCQTLKQFYVPFIPHTCLTFIDITFNMCESSFIEKENDVSELGSLSVPATITAADLRRGEERDDAEKEKFTSDMEVATPPFLFHSTKDNHSPNSVNSMSQSFHQGIFSFSNGFDRSNSAHQQDHRDKLRVQGFEPPQPPQPPLVGIEEEESGELFHQGMLSEMFNFPPGATTAAATATASDLLDNQIESSYHLSRPSPAVTATANEWYGHRQGINADSAAAMQLFLMNPQPRSPSPPQPTSFPHEFAWGSAGNGGGCRGGDNSTVQLNNTNKLGGGLSLSLSSSLQHLEGAKVEELRMGDGGMLYFNTGNTGSAVGSYPSMKNLRTHHHHQDSLALQGYNGQVQNVGFGSSSLGVVNVLRNSKYVKPARELLEEFCSVGRGQFKNKRHSSTTSNPNPNGSPSSSKDIPPLSAADRIENQRRKVKLISMIDEVDRRYNHYCEQMQMVVNSFDSVMGFGAATPYTSLAQKAMSRHFRCLKDSIAAQLKHTCELLGEKDGTGASGVTKGETPRLRLLEQSLRQQRTFHQMGMMDQEAWRPQRGLPERSVNILRAWLFEHFLHPYPSDADKLLLARQTGLSRNQVSNWFINARVRLWKPMVEDMYQQEAKEDGEDTERSQPDQSSSSAQTQTPTTAATTVVPASTVVLLPTPTATSSSTTITSTNATGKRSEINGLRIENDRSLDAINRQRFLENQANQSLITSLPTMATTTTTTTTSTSVAIHHNDLSTTTTLPQRFSATHLLDDTCRQHGGILAAADYDGTTTAASNIRAPLVRFGTTTTTGDVSLTLGLRHAGNLPEKNRFAVRDFGGC